MRDLPAPSPTVQQTLARMYAERIPSRPKQIGRMPEQEVDLPWFKDVGNALGSAYEFARDTRPVTVTGGVGGPIQTEVATPVELGVEPFRVAGRRLVGDVTAIPGVGAPSPSYTAEQFRNQNPWAAALKTALDYGSIAALGAQVANRPSTLLAQEMASKAQPMDIPRLLAFVDEARNSGLTAKQFPNEFRAAQDYFNTNFPQYQHELRTPGLYPEARPNIELIDQLFNRGAELKQPTLLYRGIKNSNYIPQQEYANYVKSLKAGDILEEPGFMSTTIDRDMAEGFAKSGFVFEIEAPTGTKVLSPLMNDELMRPYADPERELLLPRNSKLEILEVNGNVIKARIVK